MADSEDLFDPAELRAWEKDPRGQRFWEAIREMGNKRMSGIRDALRPIGGNTTMPAADRHDLATRLAGELEAIDEVRQLVDIIIDEDRLDKQEKEEEKKK